MKKYILFIMLNTAFFTSNHAQDCNGILEWKGIMESGDYTFEQIYEQRFGSRYHDFLVLNFYADYNFKNYFKKPFLEMSEKEAKKVGRKVEKCLQKKRGKNKFASWMIYGGISGLTNTNQYRKLQRRKNELIELNENYAYLENAVNHIDKLSSDDIYLLSSEFDRRTKKMLPYFTKEWKSKIDAKLALAKSQTFKNRIEGYLNLEFNENSIYIIEAAIEGLQRDIKSEMFYLASREEITEAITDLTNRLEELNVKHQNKVSAQELKNDVFLKQNSSDNNTITLESGLQYEVIIMTDGERPNVNSYVVLDYIGKLLDGTEFENTYNLGEPQSGYLRDFPLGFQEILPQMSVGSRVKLTIPYKLGYGEEGYAYVPPRSTLIVDLELVAIK